MGEGISITFAETVDEARRAVASGAMPAAGMTVIRLTWAERLPEAARVVDISRLTTLKFIEPCDGGVRIGALTDLESIRISPLIRARIPQMSALLDDIAALGVRHLATLGGNVAWGSGDLIPMLMTLDARIETPDGEHGPTDIPPHVLILAVRIPKTPRIEVTEKVGYRAAFSPSLVTVALAASRVDRRLTNLRVAIGGGVTKPQRLLAVEHHLEGRRFEDIDVDRVQALAAGAAVCTSDDFATSMHRAEVAGRIIANRIWEACRDGR
ncbi:MAG: FAD binding domain-containing protein [Hyphomicrobiaceae bacterium]